MRVKLVNSNIMPVEGHYVLKKITKERFCQFLLEAWENDNLDSYIGYQDNIKIIKKWTGLDIPLLNTYYSIKESFEIFKQNLKDDSSFHILVSNHMALTMQILDNFLEYGYDNTTNDTLQEAVAIFGIIDDFIDKYPSFQNTLSPFLTKISSLIDKIRISQISRDNTVLKDGDILLTMKLAKRMGDPSMKGKVEFDEEDFEFYISFYQSFSEEVINESY